MNHGPFPGPMFCVSIVIMYNNREPEEDIAMFRLLKKALTTTVESVYFSLVGKRGNPHLPMSRHDPSITQPSLAFHRWSFGYIYGISELKEF